MTHAPDQPPPIDPDNPDDHRLPPAEEAAVRVNEFLSHFGDGLILPADPFAYIEWVRDSPPLYARDLQVLANLATGGRQA